MGVAPGAGARCGTRGAVPAVRSGAVSGVRSAARERPRSRAARDPPPVTPPRGLRGARPLSPHGPLTLLGPLRPLCPLTLFSPAAASPPPSLPPSLPSSLPTPLVPLPRPLSAGAGKSSSGGGSVCVWGRVAHPWYWGLQGLGSPRPRRQVKPSVCGLAKAGSSGRRGHACLKRPERGQPPAALGTWSSGPGGCESGKHEAALDNCSSTFKCCDSELLSKREHSDASDIEENLCNYPAVLTPLREVILDHREALPSNKILCYHSPKAEWRYKAAMSVNNFCAKKWGRVALRPQDRYAVIRLPCGSGSKSSIGIKSLNMYKNLNPFHLWPRNSISTGGLWCRGTSKKTEL
ncbi:uncharacterized protein LOC116791050 [Chiroxiphia lanceolata]|uniref:uncharacterized protein LOC116791050 n=1 Tax=Chiroxiphia lanceolata TaxID=296741 RepID=UPI0013CECC61|nr:uncharacterized protein LOC116791050 [Chiroxiphia lanceolata]